MEKTRLAKCYSGAVYGVEARTVEIEVCATNGCAQFTIVGLPDQAVKESKDRVVTALVNSGFSRSESSVTVNLAPADVRKEGPIYDLPIAVCLVASSSKLHCDDLSSWGMVGELALSGEVRKVKGVLPIVLEMRRIGQRGVIVPYDNAAEASIVEGIDIYPVHTLREAVDFLSGRLEIKTAHSDLAALVSSGSRSIDDFSDVKGQETAKRAAEVAVAGGHNILLIGSPGSGKTMLARRIASILPPLTVEEALEVTRIHSVAGELKGGIALMTSRPFRSPHHTVSAAGLLGGGSHPIPGEVSLAHRGVLFLDELPEFQRNALEVMRQPLEDGHVCVSRVAASCDFPSRFMLVAAMNPCPCGYATDSKHVCRCSHANIERYRSRISGPLLDRIDIQLEVPPVTYEELSELPPGESSKQIRERVVAAREIQSRRYAGLEHIHCNADVPGRMLADVCRLDRAAQRRLHDALTEMDLSARAYDRILRVSRTIADIEGAEDVDDTHIGEAITYRSLDQSYWG